MGRNSSGVRGGGGNQSTRAEKTITSRISPDGDNININEYKPASVKEIYESLASALNPQAAMSSSLGVYYTDSQERIAEQYRQIVMTDGNEIAKNIAMGTDTGKFSSRQLWAMSYGLQDTRFAREVTQFNEEVKKQEAYRKAAKAKARAAKDARRGITRITNDALKSSLSSAGMTKKSYETWLKESKYKGEYYSKNYSKNSLDEFLKK